MFYHVLDFECRTTIFLRRKWRDLGPLLAMQPGRLDELAAQFDKAGPGNGPGGAGGYVPNYSDGWKRPRYRNT
jgi:hypothetical protein